MFNLGQIDKYKKILRILARMNGTRRLYVCLGDDTSKTLTLANWSPQDSVITPTLFNVCPSGILGTKSLKLGYADFWALLYQSKDLKAIKAVRSDDLSTLNRYIKQW